MLVLITCRVVSCPTTENAYVGHLSFTPSEEQVCCISRPGLWKDTPGQDSHTGGQRPCMSPPLVFCNMISQAWSSHSPTGCCRTLPLKRSLSSLVPQSTQLLLPHRAHASGTHRLRLQPLAKQMFSLQTASASSAFLRDNPQLTVTGTGNPFALPADPRPFLSEPKHSWRSSTLQSCLARSCSGILRLLPRPGPTSNWKRWTKRLSSGLINRFVRILGDCSYFSCELKILHVWFDAAALPSRSLSTVACRSQRLHHFSGQAPYCSMRLSLSHPWHRLEAASPGAHPSSAQPFFTACPDTQVLNRLEVSSPEPYLLNPERVSMSLDPPKVVPPSAQCLHLYHDDLSCALSYHVSLCGARWIVARHTACIPLSPTAVPSQTEFKHCHLLYPTARTWPSALPKVNRLLGPLPKHDPPPGQAPLDPTPRRRTALRDLSTLLFLRLPAPLWLPETCLLPQRRYRRLQGLRFSPTRRSRPRRLPHHTRCQGLRRRTRRVFPPVPMLRCPATGLIRSWGEGGAGVCTCTFLRTRPPPPSPTLLGTNTLHFVLEGRSAKGSDTEGNTAPTAAKDRLRPCLLIIGHHTEDFLMFGSSLP